MVMVRLRIIIRQSNNAQSDPDPHHTLKKRGWQLKEDLLQSHVEVQYEEVQKETLLNLTRTTKTMTRTEQETLQKKRQTI